MGSIELGHLATTYADETISKEGIRHSAALDLKL